MGTALPLTLTQGNLDTAIRSAQAGARSGLCNVSLTVVEAFAVLDKVNAIAKVLGMEPTALEWSCDLFTRTSREDQVLTMVCLRPHGITVHRRRPSSSGSSGLLHVTLRNGKAW